MSVRFNDNELTYLRGQRLGRLATVDADGVPQNNPVGFVIDEATGDVLIGGYDLAASRKFRNVAANPRVAFVVDDLPSVNPWRVRGVELRGVARAMTDVDPPRQGMSRAIIRVRPHWIGSWGIEPGQSGMTVRRAAAPERTDQAAEASPTETVGPPG